MTEQLTKCIREVVGEVGIFGALAVLHDHFEHNPSCYRTFPLIQKHLKKLDRELRAEMEAIEDPEDLKLTMESTAEGCREHGVIQLTDREINANGNTSRGVNMPTECFGLFWKRSSGAPKASELIHNCVYWDIEDAKAALKSMDSPHAIEIRHMGLSVESSVDG